MDSEQCDALFMDITGQNVEELLEMAGKTFAVEDKRLAVHLAIVEANLRGQPTVTPLVGKQQYFMPGMAAAGVAQHLKYHGNRGSL